LPPDCRGLFFAQNTPQKVKVGENLRSILNPIAITFNYTELTKTVRNDTDGGSMEKRVDVFSRKEAAKYLGVCVTTLDRLDIPHTRVRHRVFYKQSVLNKWFDTQPETKGSGKHEQD